VDLCTNTGEPPEPRRLAKLSKLPSGFWIRGVVPRNPTLIVEEDGLNITAVLPIAVIVVTLQMFSLYKQNPHHRMDGRISLGVGSSESHGSLSGE
jgi:hypothetical protein